MKNIFEILTLEDKNTCFQMLENVKSSEQFTKTPTLEIEAEKLINLAWHLTSGSVRLKKMNVDGIVLDGVVIAENISINDIDFEKIDGSNSITIFDTIQSYKLEDIATFLKKYIDL
jgi:hypothetical protein